MYLSHYHLKDKPFQISTDPRFLWLGEKHEEALATLRYGVLDNKGFLLLTGDVGTGKTTLINTLRKTLEENTLVASIRDPALDTVDFFNYTAHAFGIKGDFTSKGSFLIQFENFLIAANKANKKVLLIIDESQRISQELLEEVRLLSNIEREDSKLLNIFFVGQIEFNEILLRPENRPIRQRITVNYNIQTLTKKETGEYILHRLKIAGADAEIFKKEAIDEIFSFSKGYPRLINIICDRSLLTGFVEESKIITRGHVLECAKELEIPQPVKNQEHLLQTSDESPKSIGLPYKEHIPSQQLPQERVEAPSHQIPQEKVEKRSRGITKGNVITLSILLISILGYFIFSENGMNFLHEQQIFEFVKDSNQAPDKNVETIPEPVKVSDQKDKSEKEAVTSETLPKNEVRAPENKTLDINVKTDEQNKTSDRAQSIKNVEKKTLNNGSTQVTSNYPPDKKIPEEEPKIVVPQEKELDFSETFEKLIIPFPSNSNLPPVPYLDKLNLLVESLLKQTTSRILVTGFTDTQGNESFNQKLSEFRANTIKSYLMGRGLEESRIIVRGLGSQNPIQSNDSVSGRMANRRVEIQINSQSKLENSSN